MVQPLTCSECHPLSIQKPTTRSRAVKVRALRELPATGASKAWKRLPALNRFERRQRFQFQRSPHRRLPTLLHPHHRTQTPANRRHRPHIQCNPHLQLQFRYSPYRWFRIRLHLPWAAVGEGVEWLTVVAQAPCLCVSAETRHVNRTGVPPGGTPVPLPDLERPSSRCFQDGQELFHRR